MSQTIPTTSPDVEAWLLALLNAAMDPVKAHIVKPSTTGAYKHLVVRADLQNKATPISRYCRVGVQAWCVDASGRADRGAAFDMVASAGRVLETAPLRGFLLAAEVDSGPVRVKDPITKLEYAYVTLLLEVAV